MLGGNVACGPQDLVEFTIYIYIWDFTQRGDYFLGTNIR